MYRYIHDVLGPQYVHVAVHVQYMNVQSLSRSLVCPNLIQGPSAREQQPAVDNRPREEDYHVHSQHRVAHEQLVLCALKPPRALEGHPIGVDAVSNGAGKSAVVGRQRRIVQAPVVEVVERAVDIPGRREGGREGGRGNLS